MKTLVISTAMVASLMVASMIGYAAPPANAPAGTTGLCKDGSFYSGPTKKGACKGHKGVKNWYAELDAAAKPADKTAAAKPADKAPAAAAAASTPPAGSTGLCKDGTY